MLLIWTMISTTVAPDLPSPMKTWEESKQYILNPFFKDGEMNQGIGRFAFLSLVRVAKGFLLAIVIGTPLGFLLGLSAFFYRTFDPVIQILRPISPLAWLPLGLVIFRQSEPAAIFTIAICAMWPTVINTAMGVRSISPEYLNVGRVLKLSRMKTLRRIIIPGYAALCFHRISPLPRPGLAGHRGFGDAHRSSRAWAVFSGRNTTASSTRTFSYPIITIGLIGFGLDRLMGVVERRFKTA